MIQANRYKTTAAIQDKEMMFASPWWWDDSRDGKMCMHPRDIQNENIEHSVIGSKGKGEGDLKDDSQDPNLCNWVNGRAPY